jgi:hypothetical protein
MGLNCKLMCIKIQIEWEGDFFSLPCFLFEKEGRAHYSIDIVFL